MGHSAGASPAPWSGRGPVDSGLRPIRSPEAPRCAAISPRRRRAYVWRLRSWCPRECASACSARACASSRWPASRCAPPPRRTATKRLKGYHFHSSRLFHRLREQRYGVGDAPAQGIRCTQGRSRHGEPDREVCFLTDAHGPFQNRRIAPGQVALAEGQQTNPHIGQHEPVRGEPSLRQPRSPSSSARARPVNTPKSNHMTLAQRGSPMIHRISPDTRVSWRTRHAQEYLRRDSRGGARPHAGCAAARAVRLPAAPPHGVVVCSWTHPDGYRGCPVLLALQRVPHHACLSAGQSGLGARRPGWLMPPVRTTVLLPTLRRSLLALLKAPPRAYGWCRTRWSCATLALTWPSQRGSRSRPRPCAAGCTRSAGCGNAQAGGARRRAAAGEPLARIRWVFEHLKRCEAIVFADELAIHVCTQSRLCLDAQGDPSGGHDPRPAPEPRRGRGPDPATGMLPHGVGPRQTHALFRDLCGLLEGNYPADGTPGSTWSSITLRSIRQRPWNSGWPFTRGCGCSFCRPTVPKPTRSSAPLAMGMTWARAIIRANACGLW